MESVRELEWFSSKLFATITWRSQVQFPAILDRADWVFSLGDVRVCGMAHMYSHVDHNDTSHTGVAPISTADAVKQCRSPMFCGTTVEGIIKEQDNPQILQQNLKSSDC